MHSSTFQDWGLAPPSWEAMTPSSVLVLLLSQLNARWQVSECHIMVISCSNAMMTCRHWAGTVADARCLCCSSRRPVCAGFALQGFGPETAFDATLVSAATNRLPQYLPRFLLGPLNPQHMLEAVQAGIDVFDSSHAVALASRGHALSLDEAPHLEPPSKAPVMEAAIKLPPAGHDNDIGEDGAELDPHELPGAVPVTSRELHQADTQSKTGGAEGSSEVRKERTQVSPSQAVAYSHPEMNLWAAEYRADKQPLVVSCQCYACQRHTRAYVHHLLQEHEMLAQVLLEVHNTWQLQRFLDAVRAAICTSQLGDLKHKFERRDTD